MRLALFAIFLFCSFVASSQSYLGNSKRHIAKRQQKIALKDSLTSQKQIDKDSILVVDYIGNGEIIFTYYFDNKYKCTRSTAEFDCERCVEVFMDGIFDEKWMKWMQISENKYMSSWFRGTMLTIIYLDDPEGATTFVFDKLRNKEAYDKLKALHYGKEIKYGRDE